MTYFTGTRSPLRVGDDILANRRKATAWEALIESARPAEMPSRLDSFFLVKDDPALVGEMGPQPRYIYEVEPIGVVAEVDYGWLDRLERIIGGGHMSGTAPAAAVRQHAAAVRRLLASYWSGESTRYGFEYLAPQIRVVREVPLRRNPAGALDPLAVEKFVEFNRFDPRATGTMATVDIPDEVWCLGAAVHVMYRSDKVDPETLRKPRRPLNYIHDHDTGVSLYVPLEVRLPGDLEGELEPVPDWIREATTVTKLGDCLGYRFLPEAGGRARDVEGTRPLPELYCTPCGRALLVVQSKRQILALMWGGMLGVEARGIVG